MIFIGYHPAIDCEKQVAFVESKEQIANTPAGSLVVMEFDKNELEFYSNLNIPVAVFVSSIEEFMLAGATKIRYAICRQTMLAKELQEIADHYLLDIKVLVTANSYEIESVARMKIDGVFIAK